MSWGWKDKLILLFVCAGLSLSPRGDKAPLPEPRPHILVMSLPADGHSPPKSRRKRQTDAVCTEWAFYDSAWKKTDIPFIYNVYVLYQKPHSVSPLCLMQ